MPKLFDDKLIPNDKIKKGKRIGNGQFGEVFKGKYVLLRVFRVYLKVSLISSNFAIDKYEHIKIKNAFIGIYRGPAGEQEVAIKVPKITFNTAHSPVEVERMRAFLEEAQRTSGFNHENILSFVGISTGWLCQLSNY